MLTACSALDLGSKTWGGPAFLVASLSDDPVLSKWSLRLIVIEVTVNASHLMFKLLNSLLLDILGTICLVISILNSLEAASSVFCPSEPFVCG